jgi:hypothetical protein
LQQLSDERIAASEAQAAEANARANEASLRLQTLQKETNLSLLKIWEEAGPRRIDPESFKRALEGHKPAHVEILYLRDASDAFSLANTISALLKNVGWTIETRPIPEISDSARPLTLAVGGQLSGVTVVVKKYENDDTSPYRVLMKAISLGLGIHGIVANRHESMPEDMIRVVIGPKL